jgi:hypothetical protein
MLETWRQQTIPSNKVDQRADIKQEPALDGSWFEIANRQGLAVEYKRPVSRSCRRSASRIGWYSS